MSGSEPPGGAEESARAAEGPVAAEAAAGPGAPVGTLAGDEPADSTAHVGTIGRKAGRGLRWSLVGNLGTKLGSFTIGLILARLLAPADFGVFAVAAAATAFVMHVNDIGVIAAGVQWRGKLEDMAPTGTTVAIGFSTLVYAAFFFGAPAFATLAGTPDAAPVVRLLTVIIIVDGITSCRSAALMRRFEQDRLTRATMIGMAANFVVAVPLAFAGGGAYSFAGGQVAGSVVTGIIVWRMGNLPLRLGFDRAIAVRLFTFGIPLAASLGVESVLLNADYVIVGNVLGAAALGYYLLAFNVSNWVPGLVGTAVRYVSIPSFSRLAEQETDALATGVRRSVPVLISAILPVAVLMAVLAPYMVVFLYGDQWGPSAYVLRFLTILMVVRMLTSLAFDILTSVGATRSTVVLNAGWAIALIPALWLGTHLDNIRGAAIAHGAVAVVVALPLAIVALHRAGVPLLPVLPDLVRPAIGAVLCAAATMLVVRLVPGGAFLHLFVPGVVGMLVFVLTVVPVEQFRQLRTRLARAR